MADSSMTTQPSTVDELRAMEAYERFTFFKAAGRGLQAKVAAEAEVDQSLVSRVCSGAAQSQRVEQILDRHLATLRAAAVVS